MAFYKLFIITACATVACCEDCLFELKRGDGNIFGFDLTVFNEFQTVNVTEYNDLYTINIKLCNSDEQTSTCDGIRSKICLIKNKNNEIDIGSRIKEVKLDVNDQLFMSLEGNTICEQNKKHVTDIQFVCDKSITGLKIVYKPNLNNRCKHTLEFTSVVVCSIDDFDIRKTCDFSIPHSQYKFNMRPLRRSTSNYLVRDQNRHFEVNICGRLIDNNKCGGNITTICDITNATNPINYAVGINKNDEMIFDIESGNLKLIQYKKKSKKSRRIEIIFKCNENIPPEKTIPELRSEQNSLNSKKQNINIASFEITTSTVCVPRMVLCEIFRENIRFNLKPLHKRVGNWIVPNEKVGGYFYLNICDYLNQYGEQIPISCKDNKTSACYKDSSGKGIPIGSTQIGPYFVNNSILLKYTDGMFCKNSLNWTTTINLICSNKTQLIHDKTISTSCIHTFKWSSPEACNILFQRKDHCVVTHPYFKSVYNMSNLKGQIFEVNDYEDSSKFQFSICGTLRTSCNGYLNSAVCWLINGVEKNIGIFTEQVVFDNGKIYMSMVGEKCVSNGPASLTTIQFVCDYSDSKSIDFKKDLYSCNFDFIIYTKQACAYPKKINCTVQDDIGNVYDLSKLTKLNRNYEISISKKKRIVLNVCHSVISNTINGIDCQPNSGVCLIDSDNLEITKWYKNLGDIEKIPRKEGNKIILEMENGFYDSHSVSSVIEFVCSKQNIGPKLMSEINYKYVFLWSTPLVCPNSFHSQNQTLTMKINTVAPIFNVTINGLNYSTYICPKDDNIIYNINCDSVEIHSNDIPESGQIIILNINEQKIKKTITQKSNMVVYNTNKTCNENKYETEKIIFSFVCGFELQKPKIEKKLCRHYVLNVNPEICEQKLTCNAGLYNLLPLKGSYVVNYNERIKYYISMCMAGKNGVGGIMSLNGKNYSLGYQMTLPKSVVSNMVEINFEHGDYCLENNNGNIKMKYSTIIRLQCDISVVKGHPIFVKLNDKCRLEFAWNTSHACQKKLVKFENSTCAAIIEDYSEDFVKSRQISLKNILNNNSKFVDHSTNTVYSVHFCNASICVNGSKCIENMSLQYDIYNKQLIASFKNTNKNMNFTNVDIIITCSNSNYNDLSNIEIIDNEIIINTNSEGICCMDFIDRKNYEICKKYTLAPAVTTTQIEIINVVNDKSRANLENYHSDESVSFDWNEINENYFTEKLNSINKEQIKTSVLYNENNNKNSIENNFGKPNIFVTKNQLTTSFHISGPILLMILLMIISLAWFYRIKLRYKIRKLLNSSSFNRRRARIYNQNLIEIR